MPKKEFNLSADQIKDLLLDVQDMRTRGQELGAEHPSIEVGYLRAGLERLERQLSGDEFVLPSKYRKNAKKE